MIAGSEEYNDRSHDCPQDDAVSVIRTLDIMIILVSWSQTWDLVLSLCSGVDTDHSDSGVEDEPAGVQDTVGVSPGPGAEDCHCHRSSS